MYNCFQCLHAWLPSSKDTSQCCIDVLQFIIEFQYLVNWVTEHTLSTYMYFQKTFAASVILNVSPSMEIDFKTVHFFCITEMLSCALSWTVCVPVVTVTFVSRWSALIEASDSGPSTCPLTRRWRASISSTSTTRLRASSSRRPCASSMPTWDTADSTMQSLRMCVLYIHVVSVRLSCMHVPTV